MCVYIYSFYYVKPLKIGFLWTHLYAVPITILHTHRSGHKKISLNKIKSKQIKMLLCQIRSNYFVLVHLYNDNKN